MPNYNENAKNFRLVNNLPLDDYYGPYNSLAEAYAGVPSAMRANRTIGIIESGKLVEYVWHSDNITNAGLVKKTSSSVGGASLPTGGAAGFALVKKSDADNDAEWVDIGAKDSVVTSGGDMSFTSGTLTVEPTFYKIKGTAYSKATATNFTGIALSATNKQRWGIVYGTTSNTVLKLEEAETDTDVTLKPILPANSCLIGEFLIGDEEATIVFPDLSKFATKDELANSLDFSNVTTGTGIDYVVTPKQKRTTPLVGFEEIRIRAHTPNTNENFTLRLRIRNGSTRDYFFPVKDKNGSSIPVGMFKGDMILRYNHTTPKSWRAINIDASKLEVTDVYNGLDQTSSGKALDARQGKILNDAIGDKTSLITTFKTNLVGAINEIKSSIASFINKAGDTFTGTITTAQSNATSAALRIQPGVQKTTGILDGDIDFNNSFLRIRINGVWQNMFFVPSNPSSLRVLSQSSSGNILNNIEVVDPLVSSSALDAATWTTETLTLTGIQGQEAFGNEYAYKCIGSNTWIRTPRGLKRVDMWLGGIDDSGGIKTTSQLNTAYPNAVLSQKVRGLAGIYEKFAPNWRYTATTIV